MVGLYMWLTRADAILDACEALMPWSEHRIPIVESWSVAEVNIASKMLQSVSVGMMSECGSDWIIDVEDSVVNSWCRGWSGAGCNCVCCVCVGFAVTARMWSSMTVWISEIRSLASVIRR